MMILMLITLFHAYQFELFDETTITFSKGIGFFLVFYIIFYLGTRPISYEFGDMGTYGKIYNRLSNGETFVVKKDYLFNYLMIYSSKIMNARWFFFLCALIYILPCFLFSKNYGGSYWFFVLFIFVGSYMFWL